MINSSVTYCLDANVLIQAWQKYYSPRICPDYWDLLNQLGADQRVFIPREVYDEIIGTEDALSDWLKRSSIPIRKTDSNVTDCWKRILGAHNDHQYLVAEAKGRSMADPWLISHALDTGATVVTKEELVLVPKPTKIKIPNVCGNMGILCINDFQLIEDLGIKFSCQIT